MKVTVDRNVCCGYGNCVELAGDVFSFDEKGILTISEQIDPAMEARVIHACEQCPTQALTIKQQ